MCASTFLALMLNVSSFQARQEVAVYVFTTTDPSGFTDQFQTRRLQSLAELKAAIDKRKNLVVVETAEAADITLEIVDAGHLNTGNVSTRGLSVPVGGTLVSGASSKPEKKPQVHTVLRAGSYSMGFHGIGRSVRNAATGVAQAVKKWAKQNEMQLAEKRGAR